MKRILLALLLIGSVAYAQVTPAPRLELKQAGSSVGQTTIVNFQTGASLARDGSIAGQVNVSISGTTGSSSFGASPSVQSTGSITCVGKSSLVNNDYFSIGDDSTMIPLRVFEYEVDSGSYVPTPGRITIDVSSGMTTPSAMRSKTMAGISASDIGVFFTLGNLGGAGISIVSKYGGALANVALTENVANAGFLVTGLSGGGAVTSFTSLNPLVDFSAANNMLLPGLSILGSQTAGIVRYDFNAPVTLEKDLSVVGTITAANIANDTSITLTAPTVTFSTTTLTFTGAVNLGATSVDSLSVAGFNLTDVGFDDTSHSIYIVESGGDADKVLTIHGQNGAQGGGDSNGNDLQLYAGLGFGAGSNGSVILGQATDKVAIFGATPQAQSAPIADAAGGAIIDAEARTALNALLAYFRLLGPIHP